MYGFRSSFSPAFWMHHCNVDRFYEAYVRDQGVAECAKEFADHQKIVKRRVDQATSGRSRRARKRAERELQTKVLKDVGNNRANRLRRKLLRQAHIGAVGFPNGPWGRYEPFSSRDVYGTGQPIDGRATLESLIGGYEYATPPCTAGACPARFYSLSQGEGVARSIRCA